MQITDLHQRKLDVLALDFESFYEVGRGSAYSLSKLTSTMYIRDPRFKAHGCSIRTSDKAYWISHNDLPAFFDSINWSNTALLCHNTAFDGLILQHHYHKVPAYYLDTLSMSRGQWGPTLHHSLDALGHRLDLGGKLEGQLVQSANIRDLPSDIEEKIAIYANRDTDLLWEIFDKMYYDLGYPEQELHIIDVTIRAFCDPILKINTQLCLEEIEAEQQKKAELIAASGATRAQLASNQQFAKLLEAAGITPPIKTSPTTGKDTFAFSKADDGFQNLASIPEAQKLIDARLAVKSTLGETRAQRFIEHSNPALPVLMNYCAPHTHRWSAGDKINLQNLPSSRKGQSTRLRNSIEAPPGHVLVVIDSAQIEPRTNGWAADETELLDAFRNKEDVYCQMASYIYGYPINKKDHPEQRQLGKATELGAGYGMGWAKFQATVKSGGAGPAMDLSMEMSMKAINTYRAKRKKIVHQWKKLDTALLRMSLGETFSLGPWDFYGPCVKLPSGLTITYYDLKSTENNFGGYDFSYRSKTGITHIYGAKLNENLIQSTARDVIIPQALTIAKEYRVVLLVHDEIVFVAPEKEADYALQFGLQAFRTPPDFAPSLPLDAEGGYGRNYSK